MSEVGVDVKKIIGVDSKPSVSADGIGTQPNNPKLDDPRQTLEKMRREALAQSGLQYDAASIKNTRPDVRPVDPSLLANPINTLKDMQNIPDEQRKALGLDED